MKILIADDEQIVRFGLKIVLKSLRNDIEISEAVDIDSTQALLLAQTYDLAVLDIHMPGTERLEDLIKFSLKGTKIIIFSSYEKTNARLSSLKEVGVNKFVFKDATVNEIKTTFLKYL